METPENIQKILKEFTEKPYFFRYVRDEKYTTIRNSVIDRYSYECAKHYYTQKFEFMQDVCFRVEDEIEKSNKNVFIDMFKKASSGFNQSNVDVIVKDMSAVYSRYKAIRSSLRNCDKSSKFYKSTHKDNNFRAYEYCKNIYNKCKSEIDGYTLSDLLQAICIVKLKNDFILEYFSNAIVDVVKINNNKIRTFYKSEYPEKRKS